LEWAEPSCQPCDASLSLADQAPLVGKFRTAF
jgi:hypothetical protein